MTATRLFTDFEVDASDFSPAGFSSSAIKGSPGAASYQLFGNPLSTKCKSFASRTFSALLTAVVRLQVQGPIAEIDNRFVEVKQVRAENPTIFVQKSRIEGVGFGEPDPVIA
jgi:hypothetical protein